MALIPLLACSEIIELFRKINQRTVIKMYFETPRMVEESYRFRRRWYDHNRMRDHMMLTAVLFEVEIDHFADRIVVKLSGDPCKTNFASKQKRHPKSL